MKLSTTRDLSGFPMVWENFLDPRETMFPSVVCFGEKRAYNCIAKMSWCSTFKKLSYLILMAIGAKVLVPRFWYQDLVWLGRSSY